MRGVLCVNQKNFSLVLSFYHEIVKLDFFINQVHYSPVHII